MTSRHPLSAGRNGPHGGDAPKAFQNQPMDHDGHVDAALQMEIQRGASVVLVRH